MFGLTTHERKTRHESARRCARAGVALAYALSMAQACAHEDGENPQGMYTPPATAVDASSPSAMDASPPAPVAHSDAAAPVRVDAGAPTVVALDSGAEASSADADTADASVSGEGGATPGAPLSLPDPAEKGPYEVAKLENVGVGFENPPTAANDRGDGAGCTSFIQSFGETPEAAREYALFGPNYKVELYTLYYPKNMVPGQLYPILSWANGTCAKTVGYEALLSHMVSHGFIVIATNSRYTGGGKFQLHGVDYIVKENERPESPLYKHVDVAKVGVFGHSQGGGSTWSAAADQRVKTSVVLNAGGGGTRPTPSYFVTGDKDLSPGASLSAAMAQRAAASIRLHKIEGAAPAGHITLMKEPARVYPSVVAWFRYQLLGDPVGKSWFVGSDCKLCNQPAEWDFFAKGLQ
jgi:Chlorophyllase enzyme